LAAVYDGIEDLGRGDVVKVDCAGHHLALLTPALLLRSWPSPTPARHDFRQE
jgi:hypothetical protein